MLISQVGHLCRSCWYPAFCFACASPCCSLYTILLDVGRLRLRAQLLLPAVTGCTACLVRSEAVGSAATGRLPRWCMVLSILLEVLCPLHFVAGSSQVQRSRAGFFRRAAQGFNSKASDAAYSSARQLVQVCSGNHSCSQLSSQPAWAAPAVVDSGPFHSADLQPGFSRTISYQKTDAFKGAALLPHCIGHLSLVRSALSGTYVDHGDTVALSSAQFAAYWNWCVAGSLLTHPAVL